jgi:multiple sugar transport system permease protein
MADRRSISGAPARTRRLPLLTAAGFLFPSYLGYVIFVIGPIIAVFYLSLTKYDAFSAPRVVGLQNFAQLLVDKRLITVLINTAAFTVLSVALNLVLGLGLAILLDRRLPRIVKSILRSAYFFPTLVATVYVTLIWQYLYQQDTGVINYYLTGLGAPRIPWISSANWSLLSVVILDVWKNVGFSMLVFLAGLQNIPRDYYEAASVDGAGRWNLFRHITLPLITPTIFFLSVVNTISAIQVFDAPTVLTKGGPGDSSRTLVMYLYEKGFKGFDFGYASAISVALLVVMAVFTMIQFRASRTWVHYD